MATDMSCAKKSLFQDPCDLGVPEVSTGVSGGSPTES